MSTNVSAFTYHLLFHNPAALIDFATLTASNLLLCPANRPPIRQFISDLVKEAGISSEVLLFTVIYLLRLKSKLPRNARGDYDTPQRLFLAATLVSSKLVQEPGAGLTSSAFSRHAKEYTTSDINQMERCFLGLIKYDLFMAPEDLLTFLSVYKDILQVKAIEIPIDDNMMQMCHSVTLHTLSEPTPTPSTSSAVSLSPFVKSAVPYTACAVVPTAI